MKLNEFINHIKHNSLSIMIIDFDYHETLYDGSIGSYKNACVRSEIDNCKIVKILTDENQLYIYIK